MSAETGPDRLLVIMPLTVSRHGDQRNRREGGVSEDSPTKPVSIEARESNVDERYVGSPAPQGVQPSGHISRDPNHVTVRGEKQPETLASIIVIFDHKDLVRPDDRDCRRRVGWLRVICPSERELDHELTASVAPGARRRHPAVVEGHDALDHAQAESEAASRWIGRSIASGKRLEDPGKQVHWDADAGIANAEDCPPV